jgi:hypothetical protein
VLKSDRTEGYVVDVPYTAGYHPELSPSMQQYVLLQQDIAPPHGPDGRYDYFEMGFGQGFSLNVHALTHPMGRFWGNDFNPDHVAFAKSLAAASGASVNVFADSFEELLNRDLPPFDYISLHGVWSWVSDGNRRAVVEFLRRKLKIGGVAMVSYNALPGLASTLPLRHLISQHAQRLPHSGSALEDRIGAALAFAQHLRDGGAHYFRINANVSARLTDLEEQNRRYLAHEYFNRDWKPMYFSEVARHLADAGLFYAGSVSAFGSMPDEALTPEMNAMLKDVSPLEFREDVRDFMLNTKFRRDLFVRAEKGTQTEAERGRCDAWRNAMRFSLVVPPKKLDVNVTIGMRELKLQREIYAPIIETLALCAGGMSLSALRANEKTGKLPPETLKLALTVLSGMECVAIHAGGEVPLEKVKSLNRHLVDSAEGEQQDSPQVAYLVSAGAGTAIRVDRFEQLFLREASRGADADAAASAVLKILQSRGEDLSLDGWPLTEEADMVNELRDRAHRFYGERLPRLRELAVAL